MSTKRKLREEAARQAAEEKAGQRFKILKWSYLGVCVLLLAALIISLNSAAFLMRNSRAAKDVATNMDSYIPWPKEVRREFQKLLVQNGGRVKPANTFARFSLLQINNGTRVKFETTDGKKHEIKADEWLLDALFRGDLAKEMPIFNVDDTSVISELGVPPKPNSVEHRKRDRYSYNHLAQKREKFATEADRIREKQENYENSNDDPQYQLTREETQLLRLSRNISFFEYMVGQFAVVRKGEIMVSEDILPPNLASVASRLDMSEFLDLMPEMTPGQLFGILRQPAETEEAQLFQSPFQLFFFFANSGRNLVIFPPLDRMEDEWRGIGDLLFEAMSDKSKRAETKEFLAGLSGMYESQKSMFEALDSLPADADSSARAAVVKPVTDIVQRFVTDQKAETAARYDARIQGIDKEIAATDEPLEEERLRDKKRELKKEAETSDREVALYNTGYFHSSLAYFILGFLILAGSWLAPGTKISRILVWIATGVIVLALGYDVVGIVQRSIIRDRPPITNLYDTVIFITGVTVLLALLMEYFTRRGVALILAAVAGMAGMFLSLRYEVKEATDTMDPLQAVLDTNFWLATHVTTINIGYAAGLLAMLLGAYYLLHRFLRPFPKVINSVMKKKELPGGVIFEEDKETKKFFRSISGMTYGVVCFCLFFSIVGTVLGGVWANYSWGRFWGWDPKENGALMICLWALVILHARMGGYIREIGIAVNSIIIGMIVTFSWWGVNNLGIGLHSYGFTKGVWEALYISWTVSVLIMACGIPLWLHERSKKSSKKAKMSSARKEKEETVSDVDIADGAPA